MLLEIWSNGMLAHCAQHGRGVIIEATPFGHWHISNLLTRLPMAQEHAANHRDGDERNA